eukprot:CAMPEP_0171022342 /NCGR_PEP_ID=MMETSP0736-20130129/31347_1 /TAXON_ID=186038 /ORGANISM="Fragilariopsis kerguelensis, Strain L26-C5" /LENGTH=420 /DNA_ID=CAMNT_0011461103 /DNA_START=254 /DNA_END=1517 /DNA_ORIENTATION=-
MGDDDKDKDYGINFTVTDNDIEHQKEDVKSPRIFYDPFRIRYRCRVAYDGISFSGFQLQRARVGEIQSTVSTKKNESNNSSSSRSSRDNNNPRSIQGELEKVFSQRFQRLVRVVGAGRTDRGVHAKGQAIHFDLYHNETNNNRSKSSTTYNFEPDLERRINGMLPSDIRIWNLGRAFPTEVTDTGKYIPTGVYNWNAMKSSTTKLYSYRICIGHAMHPSDRHNRWQLPWATTINPDRLEQILKLYEGDVSSRKTSLIVYFCLVLMFLFVHAAVLERTYFCLFWGALEQQEKKTGIIGRSTVRNIHRVQLVKEINTMTATTGTNNFNSDNNNNNNMNDVGDPSCYYYRIDFFLDGALYKMVRNLVGTALDVCRDSLDEETFSDLLNRPSELNYTRKNNPCKPAPSIGLTLERVFYSDNNDF